jgi:hypothetical protein
MSHIPLQITYAHALDDNSDETECAESTIDESRVTISFAAFSRLKKLLGPVKFRTFLTQQPLREIDVRMPDEEGSALANTATTTTSMYTSNTTTATTTATAATTATSKLARSTIKEAGSDDSTSAAGVTFKLQSFMDSLSRLCSTTSD